MADRSPTPNAGDPKKVKQADRLAKREAEKLRAATLAVLDTYAGRLFLWSELSRLGVYRSIWSPNAEIHYRAGRQDAGHELIARLTEASEELYLQMQAEAIARARASTAEVDGLNTPSLEEQHTNG